MGYNGQNLHFHQSDHYYSEFWPILDLFLACLLKRILSNDYLNENADYGPFSPFLACYGPGINV